MRRCLTAAAALFALAADAMANADPLAALHPDGKDVPGLVAQGPSQFCGGGEALTALYDGGYQRFADAGVTAASRRSYQLGGVPVEIVVHQMRSARAARELAVSLCKDIRAPVAGAGNARRCSASAGDTTFGYVVTGRHLASISVDEAAPAKLQAVLDATAARMAGKGDRGH